MKDLILAQKYEPFLKYMDGILQNFPSAKSNLRDNTENLFLRQVDLLYDAAMSGMPSKINAADAGLASIRFRLRYLSSVKFSRTVVREKEGVQTKKRVSSYLMTRASATTAEIILSEVGNILGSMKENKKGKQ